MILERYPETLTEARKKNYNQKFIEGGVPYQEGRCAAQTGEPMGIGFSQCRRTATSGPGGLYCYQHTKKIDRLLAKEGEEG